ncbi:MAG: hypothetical protein ABIF82_11575 [Planctomycetota bacterium]
MGNGDLGIALGGGPELQTFYLAKNDFWYALADSHYVKPQAGPRFVGGLDIETPALKGASYHAEQSIYEAQVAGRFAKGKTSLTMESWAAAAENLLVIRLEAEGGPLDVRVRLWAKTSPECTTEQGTTEDGRYFIFNDSCHEAGPWAGSTLSEMERDTNPIITLAMLRLFLAGLLDISGELGTDAGRREKWQHMLDHLSPFPTMERAGRTIFRLTEIGQDWVGNAAMTLWPVFPCGQVGRDSGPELFKVARDTHEVKDRWLDDNHFPIYFPAAARLGVDPDKIIEELHALIERGYGAPSGSLANRFIASRGGQLENVSGIPSVINEMLMQSYEDVIRIFPDWPAGRDARFGQLRADGAFLVSSELKGGQVQYVTIHSEKGRPCVIQNPWPGRAVSIQSAGEEPQTATGDTISLPTDPGQTITLSCEPQQAGGESL